MNDKELHDRLTSDYKDVRNNAVCDLLDELKRLRDENERLERKIKQ